MSYSGAIYTVEDLDRMETKHLIIACTLIVTTTFTIFMILKYSTKSMGNYKYYILLTVIAPAIMDFHVTAIFGIYPILPIGAICGTGMVSRHLGLYAGQGVQYVS